MNFDFTINLDFALDFLTFHFIRNKYKYTQLQKKPISQFSEQLGKSELRNENIFIPYSVATSSASFH